MELVTTILNAALIGGFTSLFILLFIKLRWLPLVTVAYINPYDFMGGDRDDEDS